MDNRDYWELLGRQAEAGRFACVGLDSDWGQIPEFLKGVTDPVFEFNAGIVSATFDVAGVYKVNIAFYAAMGLSGLAALKRTIDFIHEAAPEVPVILDGKRGDIGATSAMYAKELWDLGADAITVSPYLGYEAVKPMLANPKKGAYILCRTSNPGSDEFQKLVVGEGRFLFEEVAENVRDKWNVNKNCGLVAGATYVQDIATIRQLVGDDLGLLIPGVGKQGGDLEGAVKAGKNNRGMGFVVNSSSGIIFAGKDKDFALAARRETIALSRAIIGTFSAPS